MELLINVLILSNLFNVDVVFVPILKNLILRNWELHWLHFILIETR